MLLRGLVFAVAAAFALSIAPLAAALLVLGIAAAAAQGGLRIASKLMVPKFSRLNPLQGIKRVVGPHAMWEAVKAVIKTKTEGL